MNVKKTTQTGRRLTQGAIDTVIDKSDTVVEKRQARRKRAYNVNEERLLSENFRFGNYEQTAMCIGALLSLLWIMGFKVGGLLSPQDPALSQAIGAIVGYLFSCALVPVMVKMLRKLARSVPLMEASRKRDILSKLVPHMWYDQDAHFYVQPEKNSAARGALPDWPYREGEQAASCMLVGMFFGGALSWAIYLAAFAL